MFFRLFILGLIGYGVYRLFKNVSSEETKKSRVGGNVKNKPLDLDKTDVEDARYVELDDEEKQ